MRHTWRIVALILLPLIACGTLLVTSKDEADAQNVPAEVAVAAYMGAQGVSAAITYPPRIDTARERQLYREDLAVAWYICQASSDPFPGFAACVDYSMATNRFTKVQMAARIYHAIEFWTYVRVRTIFWNRYISIMRMTQTLAEGLFPITQAAYNVAREWTCAYIAAQFTPPTMWVGNGACRWAFDRVEDGHW